MAQAIHCANLKKSAKRKMVSVGFGWVGAFGVALSDKCCIKLLGLVIGMETLARQEYRGTLGSLWWLCGVATKCDLVIVATRSNWRAANYEVANFEE